MANIKFYEINEKYIGYLSSYAPHLFHNSKENQNNTRKYIGIILTVNGMDYFAPLSSFKSKHCDMSERLDFIKIKNYAVVNLNNMFPVSQSEYSYLDFNKVADMRYKSLLLAEYRIIKSNQEKIIKNANALYKHKLLKGKTTALSRRCNDFSLLEEKAKIYQSSII